MAAFNTPDAVADAERPAADNTVSAAGKVHRRSGKVYWLEYTLIGAGITTTIGTLLLFWGSAQDSLAFLLAGIVLFAIGLLSWLGGFVVMTWWLLKEAAPLVRRLLKGVRNLFPKDAPNVVEK